MKTVLMTLRFHGLGFVGGIVIAAMSLYGYASYEPTPDDLPFQAPPWGAAFIVLALVGVVMVGYALANGRRQLGRPQ